MATLRTERLSDADVAAWGERLADGIARGMQLDSRMLDVVICTLLAGGHLLLEDRPGVGKTQLARSLAASIDGRFARVQGTVDLLPTDVLGTTIWRASTETFEFHPGPIFANVVLVDELNRATPKTQSGLLEAMAEQQVTVEGERFPLPTPFHVIATWPFGPKGCFHRLKCATAVAISISVSDLRSKVTFTLSANLEASA